MADYAQVPDFGQITEFVTQGPLVGGIYGVVINRVPVESIPLETLPLQAAKADYEKLAAISPTRVPDIATSLSALQANIGAAFANDVIRYATDGSATALQVVTKLINVVDRPDWKVGIPVAIDGVYKYPVNKNLYQAVQKHTTQVDWPPDVARSLWKRFYEPADGIQPWEQPLGSFDAYPLGAKVIFGGFTWQSTINANVWAPGTGTLWKKV